MHGERSMLVRPPPIVVVVETGNKKWWCITCKCYWKNSKMVQLVELHDVNVDEISKHYKQTNFYC
jgi:hypothetical protein